MRYLTACALVLSLGAPAVADTIYVPGDYPVIQTAINAATNGDTILVSPGTYFEHDINLNGKSLVIESTAGSIGTTIDGEALGKGFIAEASEEQVTIRGFSFINTEYWVYAYNLDLAIEIDDCRFLSSTRGGANLEADEALITNCTFSCDMAQPYYEPLYLYTNTTGLVSQCLFTGISVAHNCVESTGANTFYECVFENNSVPAGKFYTTSPTAIFTLHGCTFRNITSNGLLIELGGHGLMHDCLVLENSSDGIIYAGSSVSITNTNIEGNSSSGSDIVYVGHNSSIVNTNFASNAIGDSSDWLIHLDGSNNIVDQCTLAGNTRGIYAGSSYNPTISNTHFCENNDQDIFGGYVDGGGNEFLATCGDVEGACCVDDVCYEVEQFFCDASGGEWLGFNAICEEDTCAPQPQYGACCINGEALSLFDYDCERFQGTFMGEGTDPNTVDCPAYCPGDVTGDGQVNVEDLLTVIANWNNCP